MTETTRNVVIAALSGDSSVSAETARAAIALLEGKGNVPVKEHDRILSRQEVAQLIGRSTRTVDLLSKSGVLRRVTVGTRKRSFGILASSLVEAMRCGASGKAVTA